MPTTLQRPSRREFLAQASVGLLLTSCEAQRGASAAVAGGGPYRSLRELNNWRPEGGQAEAVIQQAAWTGAPLAPLRRQLQELSSGRRRQPVHIVQFGDSHTASPFLVPRLRELFQARYGAVGPGLLPPGTGPRYTRLSLAQAEQLGQWDGSTALRTPGPFSLPGYRLRGQGAGSRLVLRSTEPEGFDRFRLEVLIQPGGGSFRLLAEGQQSGALPTNATHSRRVALPYEPGRRQQEIALELLGDGPVELLGWALERRGPGVLVEGFGINGATLDLLSNMDQGMLEAGLRERQPALVILAFGTNEAVSPSLTAGQYAAQLTERVRAIKSFAPGAGIMLMGAPDAARRRGRGNGCDAWMPFPGLPAVREAQRSVAAAQNLAFWDWSRLTGGTCGLHAGTLRNPRLVQDDHVHFTADGYRATAERMFDFLTQGPAA
jgi:lysophospholipase L1-like esterase